MVMQKMTDFFLFLFCSSSVMRRMAFLITSSKKFQNRDHCNTGGKVIILDQKGHS
jgi:hypothetical protein